MSSIQSPYFLLYQLGLNFGLPAEKCKRDIEKLSARRGTKSRKISQDAMDVVATAFELDTNARRDLQQNLQDHLPLYLDIEAGIWTIDVDQRLVDWTLANHLFIPVVARMMAFWYLDNRNDVGMPDGRFWYLPEPENGPDSPLILPVANVVNWLLDLLGASPDGLVERRADDVRDGKIIESAYDSEEVSDLAQSLYKWKSSKRLPNLDTIDKYFPDELQDKFTDALGLESDLELDEKVERTLEFCRSRRNQLTPKILLGEIDMHAPQAPPDSRIVSIFNGCASELEKARFVDLMVRRYQTPVSKTVRQRLKLARASQDIFQRCKKYFSEEKARQLIELYKFVYNITVSAEPKRGTHPALKWAEANENFKKLLGPLDFGVLNLFENFEEASSAPAFLKNRLTRIFMEADENATLPDFFSPEGTQLSADWAEQDIAIEDTLGWYRQALDRGSVRIEIKALDDLWRLFRIAQDNRIDVTFRQTAIERLDALTQGTRLSGIGLFGRLAIARAAGDEMAIELIRAQILNGNTDHAHAPLLRMQLGKHALSNKDFESAQKYFGEAARMGKGRLAGSTRGELSFHLWNIRRHLSQKGNLSQEEAWEKGIKTSALSVNDIFKVLPTSDWYDLWCGEHLR